MGSLTWIAVAVRTRRERFCSAAGASMYQGSSSGAILTLGGTVHAV